MSRLALILGGGSDMGRAIAHAFAAEGFDIALAARDPSVLEADRADLALRHRVEATAHAIDAEAPEAAAAFYDALPAAPHVVISVIGWMGDQNETAADLSLAQRAVSANFFGPAWLLEEGARRLAAAGGRRAVIGVSSVAGDRGRATNYWYGAAKAGFTAFLSGLRQKYAATDLAVITVKPGFVDTKMTAGMDLPGPLTASAEEIGKGVFRAWDKGRQVVYLRPIWRLVMTIIAVIPESIFKRLKF